MVLQRRFLLSPVHVLITVMLLLGAMAGKWAGNWFQLHDEEEDMDVYMSVLMSQANRIITSAQKTLEQANRSPFAICSDEDKRYLGELLFGGYHIKDIGRLVNDRLQCSALLNDINAKEVRSTEDVRLKDGTYVYQDHALITPGSHGPVMGRGEANVVLSSVAFDALQVSQYNFVVFLTNADKTQFARLYNFPEAFPENIQNSFVPTQSSRFFGISDNILREKTCDPVTGVCISVVTSQSWDTEADRLLPFVFTALGMLVGGGLGAAWIYYRNRDRSLISLLKKALAAKALTLVYQPVVNIGNGKITAFEALIRWEITKDDFVPPDVFIARAEAAGIADRITLYVLDRVLLEMGELLRQQRSLRINVNMTAGDVQNPAFMAALEQRLNAFDIKPEQIGLELTERTAVDFSKATDGIKQLRARGHRIYIDDFGTGYSNLAYLGELQVDAIKIDKAFTRTVGDERGTVSIVPQIISMGYEHGLDIVVEGLETEAQVQYFRGICNKLSGQGWFFGRPVDALSAQALVGNIRPTTRRGRNRATAAK
jgi:sensor c-di-GMP phosphodiesterase-like protein